ncbi:nuclear transport factor 2 family protein [Aquimarina litoralis]|uniref:nuclear transport factor 2 family protein n=1 Tax=Aquimarina litoralis TaxID=584605 RepID=UPI001C571E90|nr:nuclear transport factor 2 family protein [Aquimarina litoralis]MBW1294117.1 DUF4440 domain-containing protein [Aquimarina litoralis]
MKNLVKIVLCVAFLGTADCKSQNSQNDMKNEIITIINKFVIAGTERNIAAFDEILHPDFRVVVNQYPTPDKTAIIPSAGYIALMTQKKIGGTAYHTDILHLDVKKHSATVIVLLKTPKNSMQVTFLLVRNKENQWKIISDFAIQNPKV